MNLLPMSVVAAAGLAASVVAAPVPADHVAVELVGESTALVPGRSAWLGLRFVHEPHWHTYWINPGDSGLATKLRWNLPAGFRAGEIEWPVPQRFGVGELFNFGYDADVLLPVRLDVPADAKIGSVAHVAVEAKWLVCREECVPGNAMLALDLPIDPQSAADPRWQAAFARAHAAQPRTGAWNAAARYLGDRIEVTLASNDRRAGPPADAALDAFVVQRQVVGYSPPQIARDADALTLTFAKSEYFTGLPPALDLVLVDRSLPDAGAWSARAAFTRAQSTP